MEECVLLNDLFTKPTGLIQSISRDVHLSVTCPRFETLLPSGLEAFG